MSIVDTVSAHLRSYVLGAADRTPRVLVVDDEPAIRTYVRRVLDLGGYEVAVAESGAQALEVAATGTFDALVTDFAMPEMNGDELARRMRAASPDLKVLYLTGFSARLFHDKITLWDNEAFLDKPTTIAGLQQAVALLVFGRFAPASVSSAHAS